MVVLVGTVILVPGCESQPPAGERKPQSRPAEKPLEEPRGESPPAEPRDTEPAEPELPEYLTLLERFDRTRAVQLEVLSAAGRRLAIDTHNVRRLRIDRAQLPLQRDRSIALILDGQGIEWRADSKVVEFERSENGVWMPVTPK
jgi:hypothetical protein